MIDKQTVLQECIAQLPYVSLEALEMHPQLESETKLGPDARGALVFKNGPRVEAYFEVSEHPTLAVIKEQEEYADAVAGSGLIPVLVAPFLSKVNQKFLRNAGLNFLDMAGNAWIVAPGVFVDRRGEKRSTKAKRASRFLFSDKATLVIRLLFPGESLGVRQMSSILEEHGFALTPGYISKTVASLAEDRYAIKEDSGKVKLASRGLLLEDWAAAYSLKSRKQSVEGWYYPEADPVVLAELVGQAIADVGALTDRAGSHFVDPHASFDAVDILPQDHSAAARALRALGAEPVSRGANINLHTPAYPVSSFFGMRDIEGVPVVSDLQLYLDLRSQPKRGQEAAEHLYNKVLRPLLEEAR